MTPLEQLRQKQTIIKDRIRGLVHDETVGMYLHGRAGTSKTFLVRSTLDHLGVQYQYFSAHLTPIGLFKMIQAHRDSTIILDDVSSIFNQPIALQILLAALGTPHSGSRVRIVRHTTANGDFAVPFAGEIIAISNLTLDGHHNEVLAALRSRVFCISYEPTDEEMIASIKDIAKGSPRGVSASNAMMVANHLIGECQRKEIRPTIRLYMDKALPDYRLWAAGRSESDWRDLLASNLDEEATNLEHVPRDLSRAEAIEADRCIALSIYQQNEEPKERVRQWKEVTGKSQAALYARLKELKWQDRL